MSVPTQMGFDYGALPTATATLARAASERIKLRVRRVGEDIVEIGRDLVAVKADLKHGQFESWIEAEFEMSDQSARRFMHVAQRFGDKSNTVLLFSPKVLYALAAPSTPDEIIKQAEAKAGAGEKVSNADVAKWKREVEDAKKKLVDQAEKSHKILVSAVNEKDEEFAQERAKLELAIRQAGDALAIAVAEAGKKDAEVKAATTKAEIAAEAKFKAKAGQMAEAALLSKKRELGDLERSVTEKKQTLQNLEKQQNTLAENVKKAAEYKAKTEDKLQEERFLIDIMAAAQAEVYSVLTSFESRRLNEYSAHFQGKVSGFLKMVDRMRQSVAECRSGVLELEALPPEEEFGSKKGKRSGS